MSVQTSKKASKKATLIKSVAASVCLTLGVYLAVFSIQPSIAICSQNDLINDQHTLPTSIQCSPKGNEVSWLAWVTSKSTSNQFHFLDLLELLSQIGFDDK